MTMPEIKFKPNSKPIATVDFWYDLTTGGYIKPMELLEDQELAIKIQEAIDLIAHFEQNLIDQDLLTDL